MILYFLVRGKMFCFRLDLLAFGPLLLKSMLDISVKCMIICYLYVKLVLVFLVVDFLRCIYK